MADINIDDFYRDSALTLLRLYSSFPRPATVFVEDISGLEETDEFGMHSKRHLACFATLIWLGDEGYLRFEGPIKQEAIDQAVLTARALLLLNRQPLHLEPIDVTAQPESLRSERQTNLHRLREALKSKSSSRIRRAMLDLMSQMPGSASAD
ncbi:MAG: hypothetical protein ACR2PZ_14770 [Pseudomonadales bacterium]